MAKFTVCVPGLLTTVQDRGRMGYAASGFSPSGVMDRRAFSLGNLLVGNAANAPAIEFAFAGPTLEFENDAVVAITGADFNPRLDEERAPMYQAFVVRAGQRLSMPAAERGVYGYLAIANGGVDVPRVMGSASTNLKCGLGGFEGRRFAFGPEQALRFDDRNGVESYVLFGRALHEQRNVDARDGGDFRVAARGLAVGEHYDGGALRGNLD